MYVYFYSKILKPRKKYSFQFRKMEKAKQSYWKQSFQYLYRQDKDHRL